MTSKRRLLRGNKTTRAAECHIFVDTEATPDPNWQSPTTELQTLKVWCATWVRLRGEKVVQERRGEGTDSASWWTWLGERLHPRRGTIIWAHNAEYDFCVLRGWQLIEQGELSRDLLVSGSGCWIFQGVRNGKTLRWLDSCNWLKCPLADVAGKLGMDRKPLPDSAGCLEELFQHCRSDVSILRAGLLRVLAWHRKSDLGVMRPTLAGQALAAWRHRLAPTVPASELPTLYGTDSQGGNDKTVYPIVHVCRPALEAERWAYYGPTEIAYKVGRVEGPIHVLDLQSCYPALMGANKFPARYVGCVKRPTVARLAELAAEYAVIGSVRLAGADYEYPCRRDGKASRASGDLSTILPGPEIDLALARGQVVEVGTVYLYRKMDLFRAWSEEVIRLRHAAEDKGQELEASLAKGLANALHGKLAQTDRGWTPLEVRKVDWLWGLRYRIQAQTGDVQALRSVGGWIDVQMPPREADHSFPAASAYVTSCARIELERLRTLAGPSNVYYVYCDCLHVSGRGLEALDQAGEVICGQPGKLRREAVHDWVHYFAPGRYECPDGRHCAGLSQTYWVGPDGELRQAHFATTNEQICSRLLDGRPMPGVLVSEERYRLTETVGGRRIDGQGWTYAPTFKTSEEVPF